MRWVDSAAADALVTTLFGEASSSGPPVSAPAVKDTDDKKQRVIDLMNWLYDFREYSKALGIKDLKQMELREEDTKRQITDEKEKDEFCRRHKVDLNKVATIDVVPDARDGRVDYYYLTKDGKVFATTSVRYYEKSEQRGEFWTTNNPTDTYWPEGSVSFGFRHGRFTNRSITMKYAPDETGRGSAMVKVDSEYFEELWKEAPGKSSISVDYLAEKRAEREKQLKEKKDPPQKPPGMTLDDARQELQELKTRVADLSFSADETGGGANTGLSQEARGKKVIG